MTISDTIITKLIAYRKQNGYTRTIHPKEDYCEECMSTPCQQD